MSWIWQGIPWLVPLLCYLPLQGRTFRCLNMSLFLHMKYPNFRKRTIAVIFQCLAGLKLICLTFCGNKAFSMLFLALKMFSKTFVYQSVEEWQRCLKLTFNQTKRKREDLIFSQELSLINSFHKINLRESLMSNLLLYLGLLCHLCDMKNQSIKSKRWNEKSEKCVT